MATLKAQHLAKSYKSRQVVRDVSLSIDSGQIVGLLGPNGAGKTTCFYMIVGLVKADQGRVLIDHQDVTHQPMHGRARAGIGYLPQEASIFRKLSVADNIMAILETRKDLDRAARPHPPVEVQPRRPGRPAEPDLAPLGTLTTGGPAPAGRPAGAGAIARRAPARPARHRPGPVPSRPARPPSCAACVRTSACPRPPAVRPSLRRQAP